MSVTSHVWGTTKDGQDIHLFRIENTSGAYVEFTDWGATWVSAVVPEKDGEKSNVLKGYSSVEGYINDPYYMGAVIGRFANRIANAAFTIDKQLYTLDKNDGNHSLHGGYAGFAKKVWRAETRDNAVSFSLHSPDGEGGYPGNVQVEVTYVWSENNELTIDYKGSTDKTTYLNMTNHAYFNLSSKQEKIHDHYLFIPANTIVDITPEFIPTGKYNPVENTPFDFTHFRRIGDQLCDNNIQLKQSEGYNHCYILKEYPSKELLQAGELRDPSSGRRMRITTDLPGMLLYSAGYHKEPDSAVCFETQFFPDTPSHPTFPSCLLHAEEEYHYRTCFTFGIIE